MAGAVRSGGRLLLALLLLGLAGSLAGGTPAGPAAPDLSPYPWFYLRDGQPVTVDESVVSLVAVGDVMPGRDVAQAAAPLRQAAPWLRAADLTLGNLEAVLAPQAAAPLRQVAPWLRAADLTLGNLEAVLAPQGAPRPGEGRILLAAPAAATNWLQESGFDLLGLANNHSLDYGAAGLAGTAGRLAEADITPLGAGRGGEAYTPVVREIRGVRLAFLAFNAVPDPEPATGTGGWQPASWDAARAASAVTEAQRQAHAVVVSLHWGQEYAPHAAPWQKEAAAALATAGADLVLGHHAHVALEMEVMGEGQGLVAYGLGNLLFDQSTPGTEQGLALRALFDSAGLRAVQALPLHAGLQPRLMALDDAQSLLARIAPATPRVAFGCDIERCERREGVEPEGESAQDIFWSGGIDLTGDGDAELVRRAGDGVTIYEGEEPVWQSPPEWRVVDVALGDPNDDGRGELLLALWQEDAAGYERSQPFIVGHRGGAYQVIWGGRPVTAPILEVALGDVDGDRVQELVVLEQAGAQARLAVWQWQGWHFSQQWASAPGPFSALRLSAGTDGRLLVSVHSGAR